MNKNSMDSFLIQREKVICGIFSVGSIGRFALVGALNTLVALIGFPLLFIAVGDLIGYLPILIFCSVFNPLFSYLTHKLITFETHGFTQSEIGRYLLFNLCIFFVSWGYLFCIEEWQPHWIIPAQFGFNVVLTVIAFFVVKNFVFIDDRSSNA